MHAGIELHWAYWLLVFLGLLWLAASLVVGWIRGEDNDATGFLQWVLAHKTVAGSIAVVYLSAAGLVHETLFYSSFRADRHALRGSRRPSVLCHKWIELTLG